MKPFLADSDLLVSMPKIIVIGHLLLKLL